MAAHSGLCPLCTVAPLKASVLLWFLVLLSWGLYGDREALSSLDIAHIVPGPGTTYGPPDQVAYVLAA